MPTTYYYGSREDLYSTVVTITGSDGTVVSFTADKFSGGDSSAKETKFRPSNGVNQEISLGGSQSVGNVMVSKLHDDGIALVLGWLLNQVGKATMTVTRQPLDANGVAQSKGLAYAGKLNHVKPPPSDSESTTAALVELEQSSVTVSSV